MRFQSLLFDLDGTLTDPKEGITSSVQYALRAFGIEVADYIAATVEELRRLLIG